MERKLEEIAEVYRRFADFEAAGRSPIYESLCHHIADDSDVLSMLADLPPGQRQPNLVLASFRSLFGTPSSWTSFRASLLASREAVVAEILKRSTQTNEPARCATLLPLLARLPQPLALIEVGASAGLCLLPDRYSYRYGDYQLNSPDEDAPCFRCHADGATPLPRELPTIAWRCGLDTNPLALEDDDAMNWLETLVWPGQEQRRDNLRRAIAVARRAPPPVIEGDLLTDLRELCSSAPPELTLVVFHSAVLSYVRPQAARDAFAAEVMDVADVWISNEGSGVFPTIAARAGRERPGMFLLAQNGTPVAWTDPHGASIEWIA